MQPNPFNSLIKVAVFNIWIQFYPTVLGLIFMRPSEVINCNPKKEPTTTEPKTFDRFTSPTFSPIKYLCIIQGRLFEEKLGFNCLYHLASFNVTNQSSIYQFYKTSLTTRNILVALK